MGVGRGGGKQQGSPQTNRTKKPHKKILSSQPVMAYTLLTTPHLEFAQAAPPPAAAAISIETPAPSLPVRPLVGSPRTPRPLPIGVSVAVACAALVVEVFESLSVGDKEGFLQKSLKAVCVHGVGGQGC